MFISNDKFFLQISFFFHNFFLYLYLCDCRRKMWIICVMKLRVTMWTLRYKRKFAIYQICLLLNVFRPSGIIGFMRKGLITHAFLLLFFKHTRDRLSMSHYFSALLFGIIHKVAFIFKLCDFEWKLFCFSWSEEGDCVGLGCDFGLEILFCSVYTKQIYDDTLLSLSRNNFFPIFDTNYWLLWNKRLSFLYVTHGHHLININWWNIFEIFSETILK